MLLSPGHSPRQISPSPAPSTPSAATPSHPPASGFGAAAPSTASHKRRRDGPEILDEDTYVAAIERIIERDFFPDLPKLRERLDWLEAARSRDPVLLREVQLKILDRRRRRQSTATPGTHTVNRFASSTPFGADPTPNFAGQQPDGGAGPEPGNLEDALSLDEFFRHYTSEDNESFSRILEKVNRRRREKYAHLLEGEKPHTLSIEEAKRDRITDGYGTSGQPPSTLEGAKFMAKNLLMYYPADRGEAPLTEEERDERLKGLTKEIDRSNTRFHSKALSESSATKQDGAEILYAPVAGTTPVGLGFHDPDKGRKYDLEDLRRTPNKFYVEADKGEGGYSFVKTPSPAPGVDESPFMTWGEIEGTPLRLDFEDLPGGSGGSGEGPHFKIPPLPVRDVKAHLLSRDAAKKIKERRTIFHKPPLPSPARRGSASPRTLSPAAQKFVRNAIAKSSRKIDETLRASYRGSSPMTSTPKSRFSVETSLGSRSPSSRQGSTPPAC